MKNLIYILTGCLLMPAFGCTQSHSAHSSDKVTIPWSQQLTKTVMALWKDSFSLTPGKPAKWSYDQGVILKGIEGVWNATGNGDYFRYIQKCMDHYVQDDGTIRTYKQSDYNIDNVNNGKILLFLYRVTGKEKYKKAADLLRNQLLHHPRTSEGGFWHKKIYPWQMWLDGLYMGEPFYAEYAMLFHEDTAFNDIARQFILMEKRASDPKTGLLYHGWDESRQQKWADKKTGRSSNFWGRSLGWFGMALVDALDYFPEDNSKKDALIAILNRFASAVTKFQDKDGLWYQVVDKPDAKGNYHEASASCMLVYTLAKGVRMGYLPSNYLNNAKRGYEGIIKEFIETDANGQLNLKGTVQVAGLGGNPYRDGSYAYYLSEPVVVNDPKGMGAFILCSVEMEMQSKQIVGRGKTVLLDNYFNNEKKKDATGVWINYHYTWDDKMNSGFSMFGNIFRIYGAATKTMHVAPAKDNLQDAAIYIIVDPDTEKETDKLNYIQPGDINVIADWVKAGGVLLLMGNDSGNAEFEHFNHLASVFGIRFNEDSRNRVLNDQFEMGAFSITAQDGIFNSSEKIYIKELSSITLSQKAEAVFKDGSHVIMAASKYGSGTVFAIGDPWLYNEYVDGRKLPATYENYKAAADLVKWLLAQTPAR